jgi:membrane protein DedA with SNARE-associated domain
MLFAGFNVSEGHYSIVVVTLVATLANLAGSLLAYAIGYYGRVDLVEKHGHLLFIKVHHVQAAERWFDRHGDATVFFTRMMPIIRTFISVPAGAAKMPLLRFSVLTFLGCLPWIFGLTFIGEQVGANWTDWKDSLKYVDYAVVALVAAAIVLIVLRGRRRRGAAKPAADAGAG